MRGSMPQSWSTWHAEESNIPVYIRRKMQRTVENHPVCTHAGSFTAVICELRPFFCPLATCPPPPPATTTTVQANDQSIPFSTQTICAAVWTAVFGGRVASSFRSDSLDFISALPVSQDTPEILAGCLGALLNTRPAAMSLVTMISISCSGKRRCSAAVPPGSTGRRSDLRRSQDTTGRR